SLREGLVTIHLTEDPERPEGHPFGVGSAQLAALRKAFAEVRAAGKVPTVAMHACVSAIVAPARRQQLFATEANGIAPRLEDLSIDARALHDLMVEYGVAFVSSSHLWTQSAWATPYGWVQAQAGSHLKGPSGRYEPGFNLYVRQHGVEIDGAIRRD